MPLGGFRAMRINKDKRIGRVIYFVEGPKDEPRLLRSLFHDILGYQDSTTRPDGVDFYIKKDDPYSRVYVVPMPSSALVNVPGDETFLDGIYALLSSYGLQRDEAAVYYLFDRDRQSNKVEAVLSRIELLKNPYDNGTELPGALLLSYPCLQSYYVQAHGDASDFPTSKQAKAYANSRSFFRIDDSKAIAAAMAMLRQMSSMLGRELSVEELSDYSLINLPLFSAEEAIYLSAGAYRTLSLFSLSLIDLGIIELD